MKMICINTFTLGETCRSAYERGFEHLNDVKQLKPSSHMLKHLIDKHEHDNFDDIEFRMEILSFSRTAYERQIMEAVQIQLHRDDNHLLNSRAEFNRSAIPRLGLKLGDNEFRERKQEESDEEKKEESIMMKIRELKKERNRKRGNLRRAEFRTRDIEPCKKRRKLDNQNEQQGQGEEVRCTQDAEKRTKPQEERPSKKQRTLDKYILSRTEPQQNKEQRPDVRIGEKEITEPIQQENLTESCSVTSQDRGVDHEDTSGKLNQNKDLIIDWESRFKEHKEILEEEARVRESRLVKSDIMRASWDLARLCREYIRENSKSWRGEEEERRKKREKEKERLENKQRVEEQKQTFKQKLTQKKIMDTMQKLPNKERKK